MELNADFSKRVVVHADRTDWVASPSAGVARKMLDRIGGEVARATTIVRFDPGSDFAPHTHDGGEEYLVLEGTFCDETGAFPVGSYVRNPPTSSHRPSAPDGATILVKLHQFDPADRQQVHQAIGLTGDVPLFADAHENVRIEHWPAGQTTPLDATGGMEVFVLSGGFTQGGDTLTRWDWLRLPVGTQAQAVAGPDGARVWVKSGHLRDVRGAAAR